VIITSTPGANVMIFCHFLGKYLAFFTQIASIFAQKMILRLAFRKIAIFGDLLFKIAKKSLKKKIAIFPKIDENR
jgi:hypothetical protein